MKVITLWQPWASLVAIREKTIETRSWETRYRGPLAIHAAARRVKGPEMIATILNNPEAWEAWYEAGLTGVVSQDDDAIPYGAIVATCQLADVLPIGLMGEQTNLRRVEHNGPGSDLWLSEPDPEENGEEPTVDISYQRPYGDFTPGRFAWILHDIRELDRPIPVTGHQGLWDWVQTDQRKETPHA